MLGLLLRVVLSLAVVVGIVWFVARSGRRLGGAPGLVRVAGRQTLSRTASLAVVEVADRVLVLGVSEAGVRLLTELDPAQVTDQEPARSPAGPIPATASGSVLSGSMLSTQTWRQAWAVATGRRAPEAATDD